MTPSTHASTQEVQEACAQVADRAAAKLEEKARDLFKQRGEFEVRAAQDMAYDIAESIRALIPAPSTPAPTDAGALAALERIEEIIANRERVLMLPDVKDIKQIWKIAREAIAACYAVPRNSAPQETRGDEPVAWRCRGEDGFYTSWFDEKPPNYYGPYEVAYAAPQLPDNYLSEKNKSAAAPLQSPRLEREGIAKAIHARRYHLDLKDTASMFAWYAENPQGTDRSRLAIYSAFQDADAILALLSPDTTVVTSTLRVCVDCGQVPACDEDCPNAPLPSNHPREVSK